MTGPERGPAPEMPSEREVPAEPEVSDPGVPAADATPGVEPGPPDIREELGVLGEDIKGTMAGTPGQQIRILILMVVLGIVMLLAFAALRSSGSLGVIVV